jgi:diguanylate cyclase (GGDEF)-like protein/PAS domain S-box-containing protein
MLSLFFRYYLINPHVDSRLPSTNIVTKQVINTFDVFLAERKLALNDAAISWPERHANILDWLNIHAAKMIKLHPDIADIGWISPEFTVRWSLVSKENAFVLDRNIAEFGINTDELKLIGETSSSYQANNSLVFYAIRIDPDNAQLGYLLASYDIQKSLAPMLGGLINPEFGFTISDSENETLLLKHNVFVDDETIVTQLFNFAGRTFMLKLQRAKPDFKMYDFIFWSGSIVSGFASLFLYWLLINAFRLGKSQLHNHDISEDSLDSILVYQALCENNSDIIELVLVDANKAAIKLLNIERSASQPIKLSKHLQLIQAKYLLPKINDVSQSGLAFECELHINSSNIGQWLKLRVAKVGNGVTMTFSDITQHLISQRNLQRSEAKFRRLIDGLSDHYIYSKDASGKFTFISHSVKRILGYEVADFQNNYEKYLVNLPNNMDEISLSQLRGERTKSYTVVYISNCLQEVVIEYHDSPVFDGAGNLLAIEGIGRDVTAELKLKDQIYYQTNYDKLTGLLNRHAFDVELQGLLTRLKTTQMHASLCYIDIDEFKLINDTCGHLAGDQMLQKIANTLGKKLDSDDVLARVGGDEFCMILTGLDNKNTESKVQTILDHVATNPFLWEDKVFHVSASIGVVHIKPKISDVISLMKSADSACYKAKTNGKNQFCVYHHNGLLEVFRKQELDVLGILQDAIEHNKLQLYFQTIKPLGSLNTNHNYEILLRMFDENGAMVNPGVFIPVAERHGLMTRVDRWVFEHTIDLLERHPKHTLNLDKCAINLSGASLNSPSLLTAMLERLQRTTVPLKKLCFEITETAAVMNLDTAGKMIDKIRLLGCHFSLDDFGAGMSSFTYLKNMNVDYVKIDGSFVKNMCHDAGDFATVKAIHEIAKSMDKQTIAEFVGDKKTEQLLQQLGVDFAQGYGIAFPMPILPMLSQG